MFGWLQKKKHKEGVEKGGGYGGGKDPPDKPQNKKT